MADTPQVLAGAQQAQQGTEDTLALSDIATNGALLNQSISELIQSMTDFSNIVLPVTKGGTGRSAFTAGALLVGDTATQLNEVLDVAVNNVLLSGGLLTPPSYGKVGLTTHVSGILPVANGGTNQASFTTYTLLAGGTTTTSLQQVSGTGTSGQILTSNGAGALPTWQTKSWVDGLAGLISAPDNIDYRIYLNAPFAMTINSTTTRSTAGTCTATFKINTTALGGSANSVSTSEQTVNRTTSNSVVAGDDIVITISSNAACEFMSFMIAYTRS